MSEISAVLKDTSRMLILHTSKSSVKYVLSTLYGVSFEIYQDTGADFDYSALNTGQKSVKGIFLEDTVYIGELIRTGVLQLQSQIEQDPENKELSSIIERVQKVSLKAIGYLAEVYLEKKEYEKSRKAIEYCLSIGAEKSDEELNSLITLFKYYLKLNREDDILNIINTLVEHPKLDSESVAILLSATLKYRKYEEGSLFGRNIFKQNTTKKLFKKPEDREKCIILFFDNILCLLQSDNYNSTLTQGIILYIQNSLGEILKLSSLSVD